MFNRYLDFHASQKATCEKYPRMVAEEIKRYTSSVHRYFNVIKQTNSMVGPKLFECYIQCMIITIFKSLIETTASILSH